LSRIISEHAKKELCNMGNTTTELHNFRQKNTLMKRA
jgi:hypothetical protein